MFQNDYFQDLTKGNNCNQYKLLTGEKNFMTLQTTTPENISGTFEASFANECGDTVRLTQGSFRVARR